MKFRIITLGCKVNQFESQAIGQLLVSRGHTLVSEDEVTDAVIINTCAVTAESGRKSRQAIRHAKKSNPNAIIAVCGCYSQTSAEEIESLNADIVMGSGNRMEFVSILEDVFSSRNAVISIDDPRRRHKFEILPSGSSDGRTRAMLKIQDGCSNFCTYCIIPYARGPVRSMPLSDISTESKKLFDSGFREIVVTGIEISSYGVDFKDGTTLIDAIRAISVAAPGVRIHLGSLEPRTASYDFCRSLSHIPCVCPHFHLSLQSGCDATLQRMGRKYDTALFYESVNNLREFFPNCGITTDLITGFPGETDDEFAGTLDFINRCCFSAMHIFPYSIRPGTPAAEMPDQLDKKTKHDRSVKASAAAHEMSACFASRQIGKSLSVLFETFDGTAWHGHSENYLEVTAEGDNLHGRVLDVQITDTKGEILCGYILSSTV